MPRKKPDIPRDAETIDLPEQFELPDLPPRVKNGLPNPDHWRAKLAAVANRAYTEAMGGEKSGVNWSHIHNLMEFEARSFGVDPKSLIDARTEADKNLDAVNRLLESNGTSIYEENRQRLEAMAGIFDAADAGCAEEFEAPGTKAGKQLDREQLESYARGRAEKKAKWAAAFRLAAHLNERAATPVPEGTTQGKRRAVEAAHVLRYMAFVSRDKSDRFLDFAEPHFKMATEAYLAYNELEYAGDRQFRPRKCDGLMLVLPPGVGKSTFGAHLWSLLISTNHSYRLQVVHANESMAAQSMSKVRMMFDPATAQGRRNIALFPDTPPLTEASESRFRLATDERQSQPTGKAWGTNSRGSGGDADGVWEDDSCDEETARNESERNKLNDRLANTWRARLRRSRHHRTFNLITTTLWHHDDPNCRLIALARQGKSRMVVLKMAHGGPDDHPPFRSLVPDRVPPDTLRAAYHLSPSRYATVYQCNPSAANARRVRRLAHYLPSDPSHQEFLRRATFCITLDPTYTKKETSDMAAFVYCGVGEVAEGGTTRQVMRVLDARTFHARQGETVMAIMAYAEAHTTHYVHVEQHSGTDATLEHLDNLGIDHIAHQPGSLSKAFRLERVAVMLDDSLRDKGFAGAVVEFPGIVGEDGKLTTDPASEIGWLETEILEFGVATSDHGLDALTQLCYHYLPELAPGTAPATMQVREAQKRGDPRLRAMYENFNKKPVSRSDELRWACAELARSN